MYYEDELLHYGVLGMKWGVRRFQPYPKGKHGTFLGQDRDDDIVIKKGSTAYRLQTGNKLNGTGQTYVSFDKLDSLNYASVTSAQEGGLNVNMRDGSGKILSLKVTNDIIAPSYQKTMEAFIKTVDNIGIKEFSKEIHRTSDTTLSKYWRGKEKERSKQFIKDFKHLKVDECRDRAYEDFTRSFMRDTKARKMFFDVLKDDGYNAVIDENDKHFGKDNFTESPMIIFDKKDLKVSKTTSITDKDAEYFANLYHVGNDDDYLRKWHGNDVVDKWDKWAGTSKRNI